MFVLCTLYYFVPSRYGTLIQVYVHSCTPVSDTGVRTFMYTGMKVHYTITGSCTTYTDVQHMT